MPRRFFDASAVRTWCGLSLGALGRAREEIDAINVYPVADGDTGTNLYLTVESAAAAVEAVFAAHEVPTAVTAEGGEAGEAGDAGAGAGADGAEAGKGRGVADAGPELADVVRAMAHGALIGARGNSGTILAQLLRGMAQVLAGQGESGADGSAGPAGTDGSARPTSPGLGGGAAADGPVLALALRRAADSARQAVAHPVEGTVLTVASAAADAAQVAARHHEGAGGDCAAVARAAYDGAREALAATPGLLPVLERAHVVDAGGQGLVTVLAALVEALTGHAPEPPVVPHARVERAEPAGRPASAAHGERDAPGECAGAECAEDGPAFEVIYLLEAADDAVARLRRRLDALGESLVVVGGDGLWNVHVHVDDAGAAVEAGVEAGRPYRIRITHFGRDETHAAQRPVRERAQRAVVAVVPGEGLAGLCAEAGATTVLARPGEPPASGELVQAVRRAHAREVVLLPNDTELRHTAAAAAEQARAEGIRVALIPTRSAVQGIAALAVHEPGRRFDEDVVAMTSAAGATRHAEVTVAEHRSWTSAGICQAGDVLGLLDGDVAVIGTDVTAVAETVLDRMLAAGGELVTLVVGDEAPEAVADRLEARVREAYLAVDTVVYHGGRQGALLLIGVE
ncbi:DAK2 domain-containing protein [Streptomyces tagetis]|uniref:DAK2 domain-containing protein n=1 Tax=Streptomyces tagetis TaxID=2820809 RepID=A0A940XNR5_9ACTN|nr:DAK2 domain-containing protein [Streptomyces sp. RG38]MBQ0827969.1 DAK2 domain-containing protein [Streptomyces sp. RG38]